MALLNSQTKELHHKSHEGKLFFFPLACFVSFTSKLLNLAKVLERLDLIFGIRHSFLAWFCQK
jgi:hypothetical protein